MNFWVLTWKQRIGMRLYHGRGWEERNNRMLDLLNRLGESLFAGSYGLLDIATKSKEIAARNQIDSEVSVECFNWSMYRISNLPTQDKLDKLEKFVDAVIEAHTQEIEEAKRAARVERETRQLLHTVLKVAVQGGGLGSLLGMAGWPSPSTSSYYEEDANDLHP
jgi:hypothetical protein